MKPRLLLLEDVPASRRYLAEAAIALPADVDQAGTLAAARTLVATNRYALWLFDEHLPDGCATDLLAQLRADGWHTPALAHTASPDPAEHARLLQAGFEAVVVKPVTVAHWQDAIRRLLERDGQRNLRDEPAAWPVDTAAGDEVPLWDDAAAAAALGGNHDNIAALRGLFLAELPAARAVMRAASAGGDGDTLPDVLHRLRASCALVGARRLDAAVRALQAAPGSADCLQDALDALEHTLLSRPGR